MVALRSFQELALGIKNAGVVDLITSKARSTVGRMSADTKTRHERGIIHPLSGPATNLVHQLQCIVVCIVDEQRGAVDKGLGLCPRGGEARWGAGTWGER